MGDVEAAKQCSGSVTYWYESGSSEPYLWLTDPNPAPAPDPPFIASDLQDANKKSIFSHYFLKVHLHHSSHTLTD